MNLTTLLERLDYRVRQGNIDQEITEIIYDSRKADKGKLFVCIVGALSDGHDYLQAAAEQGIAAAIVQKGSLSPDLQLPESLTVIETEDTRKALALVSAAWFDYPAEHIPVIGITGTKGKTTTTYMIRSILENAGYQVGLIGTIEAIIGEEHVKAANTTPESYLIHQYLRRMIDAGMNAVVMEVSSQALKLHRTYGIEFEIGVFTNLSPDHIGPAEHDSFEEYLTCKSMLFQQCKLGIINKDDSYCDGILKHSTCQIEYYGVNTTDADYRAVDLEHIHQPGYLGMKFRLEGRYEFSVELDIPGRFSVYNALTSIAVCEHFNISQEDIVKALKGASVKGRVEMIPVSDSFSLMIDYAHNAMALESLLTTLRDYHPGRIVTLFGCGGNRAKSRRYEMGEVSGRLSDFTIITSDNPRFEDPEEIMSDIEIGMKKTSGAYIKITDRKEAIAYAIHQGKEGDVIVLAGKGHEDYQEIEGKKYPMDERVLIKEILEEDALR